MTPGKPMTKPKPKTHTPQPASADRPFLASKLRAPQPPPFQVPRTDICDRICAQSARVVLVHAPAGFGKTTAMLQAQSRQAQGGIPVSWLTVDSSDNDAGRFLQFLVRAFDRLLPAAVITRAAAGGQPGPPALVMLDRVSACETPFALFLDDFEAIENPAVLALVRQLAGAIPAGGRLVIGARQLPQIGASSLRARGLLTEVTPEDLRFSVPETRAFLHEQQGVRLEEADIASLQQRAEGWPVAIRLASVALARHQDPHAFVSRFSGSYAVLADYLGQEVLARQPAPLRDFLLRTSILRELSAPLCNAVSGRKGAAAMLAQIAAANLFLVRLDDDGRLFRYHSVMAGFLRAQLERERPKEIAALHRAASKWYQRQGRPVPAVDHALASGDLGLAVPLLEQHAGKLLEDGRMRLLARWLDALPASRLKAHPSLAIIRAWALSFTRGAGASMSALDEAVGADRRKGGGADALALRVNLLTMNDKPDEADAIARAATELPAPGSFSHRITSNALAHVAIVRGHYAEARRLLADARRGQSGGPFNLLYAELMEAVIDLIQGRLRQATMRCRVAAGSSAGGKIGNTNGKALVAILLAEMLYEEDDTEQAERLLNLHLPLMQEFAAPELFIAGHRCLARVAFERGEADRALHLVTGLEQLGHRTGVARAVASAKLERARMALLKGDVAFAREELQRSRQAADWTQIHAWSTTANEVDSYPIAQLRWMVHAGAADEAAPRLKQELEQAERQLRHRRALMLRLLLALALDRSGHEKAGMRLVREALEFARKESFVRMFVDEGPLMMDLLRRYARICEAEGDPPGAADSPRAHLDRLLGAGDDARVQPGVPAANTPGGPAEPLTEKELRVLRLLAEGHSNDEMARRLFVSESTVRTHLRNIHVKFAVRNRTQAIAVARRLKLVP